MKESTHILIQQVKQGDQIAFNELVQTWYQRIYNFSWKYFARQGEGEHEADLAAEVSQKTFIRVYEKINYLEDSSKFKSWLFRIASNYCLEEDRRRRQSRLFRIGSWKDWDRQVNGTQVFEAESHYQLQDTTAWVLAAIQSLPAQQRVILLMKEYEGFTFREIAESLEISENTAKTRMYAALKQVRKKLALWNIEQ